MADYLTDADKQALRTLGYEEYNGKYGFTNTVDGHDCQILAITQTGQFIVKDILTNNLDAITPGIYIKTTLAPIMPEDATIVYTDINVKIAPLQDGMEWPVNNEPYKVVLMVDHDSGVALKKLINYTNNRVIILAKK